MRGAAGAEVRPRPRSARTHSEQDREVGLGILDQLVVDREPGPVPVGVIFVNKRILEAQHDRVRQDHAHEHGAPVRLPCDKVVDRAPGPRVLRGGNATKVARTAAARQRQQDAQCLSLWRKSRRAAGSAGASPHRLPARSQPPYPCAARHAQQVST
jgi:hypothetical protein